MCLYPNKLKRNAEAFRIYHYICNTIGWDFYHYKCVQCFNKAIDNARIGKYLNFVGYITWLKCSSN